MEIIGIIMALCILIIAHFAQVAAKQLKLLNGKMDELIKVIKNE